MRIGVQTWGSEGDVAPFAALAGRLRAAGHDVALVVTSTQGRDYAELCRGLDVAYVQAGRAAGSWQDRRRKLSKATNRLADLKILVSDIYLRYLDEMYEASEALCARSDLVIGHPAVCTLKPLACKAGKPYVSVLLWPGLLPHRCPRPSALRILSAAREYGAFAAIWVLSEFLLHAPVRRMWARAGLRPPRYIVPDAWRPDDLNLMAASSVFCSPSPRESRGRPGVAGCTGDAGPFVVCGYFHPPDQDEPAGRADALDEFLSDGAPPVYMTFGLMDAYRPEACAELLADAARLAGCRAIIQTTSTRHPPHTRSGDLYFLAGCPHRLVFPRCAAVVHHGGGGTVHTATRCGRPSVTVAFNRELLWYGQYLHRLGAAGKPLRSRRATAAGLAGRIRTVLDSPEMAQRAGALGERMREEHGVARAVEVIGALGT